MNHKTNKIIVGTRASHLALTQTKSTCGIIFNQQVDFSLKKIITEGDKNQKITFSEFGRQALFSKELDDALLSGQCDLAIHSFKDLTGSMPKGLEIILLTNAVESNDCFISEKYSNLNDLPPHAIVGTSSIRRYSILKKHFPHLKIHPIRGNIDTRIKKMQSGEYDAIILAKAGLIRVGKENVSTQTLSKNLFTPPLGQGLIAVVARKNDKNVTKAINGQLNSILFAAMMTLKKAVSFYEGGCSLPIGIDLELNEDRLNVSVYLGDAINDNEIRFEFTVDPLNNALIEQKFKENMHINHAEKICKIMKNFTIPYEKK